MRRLLTIGLAALAGLTAWFLLAEAAGIDLAARTGPTSTTHVGAGGVAIVAALAGLAAWGLLALREHRKPGDHGHDLRRTPCRGS